MRKINPALHQLRTLMRDAIRTEVLGIPTLTKEQARQPWDAHGPAVMYPRLSRIAQQFKLANTRHKRGAITDDQFNRALSRINAKLRNILYWTH